MSVPPEKPKGESKSEMPKKESYGSKPPFDISGECKKWLGVISNSEKELMDALQALNRPPKDKFEIAELVMQRRSEKLDAALAEAEERARKGYPLY